MSTESALDIIEEDSWSISFDLRGAYHHVKLTEDQWQYFGFSVTINRKKRFFLYKNMPWIIFCSILFDKAFVEPLREMEGLWISCMAAY